MFEKCNDSQNSNSIKVRKNVEIANITSKLTLIIADPTDFRIENNACVNSGRNDYSTNSESIDSNAGFCENPLDPSRCSKYGTVLVNTSSENEFISIVSGENI